MYFDGLACGALLLEAWIVSGSGGVGYSILNRTSKVAH